MNDVIQLLPESVANQIAAGEVVQRPASVVKELLENSIDAGASEIKLIIKEAGKTLIQVVDNGCGMSENDARMCFERHATSKIRQSSDLFAIRTMGFRGEALASIAAVAQVELRTKRAQDELGVRVAIEDSRLIAHEACQCTVGTNLSIKNLFFNVPARRNFLKSDAVEMGHIRAEFDRIALAHPDVFFSLHQDGHEICHLPAANLRQRIVKILGGEQVNKKLVPIKEDTEILKIWGFIGKPDYGKKVRGEQYFFVNQRFVRSHYLTNAIQKAYEDILPDKTYPLYVVFLEIDPKRVDINVHPTKQEVKFDDEKLVYNFLRVAARHALGNNNVMPTLDFETEQAFDASRYQLGTGLDARNPRVERMPLGAVPKFSSGGTSGGNRSGSSDKVLSNESEQQRHQSNLRNWQRVFEGLDMAKSDDGSNRETSSNPPGEWEDKEGFSSEKLDLEWVAHGNTQSNLESDSLPETMITLSSRASAQAPGMDDEGGSFSKIRKEPYQIHGEYIISQIKSGFLLIDQAASSERVLYEQYLSAFQRQGVSTQKALFPKTIHLGPAHAEALLDILPEINQLGFDVAEFGEGSFVVHGVPAELVGQGREEQGIIESLLEQYLANMEFQLGIHENLARSMARSTAVRRGQSLSVVEMQTLIDRLFACENPYKSPTGRKCFLNYELNELDKLMRN